MDPFGYPETEFKCHKCTEKIGNLLAILKAECTAEAGASRYHSCVQDSRPVENRGIGILQTGVPRGWRGSYSVDNVRELQPQLQQNPPLNVLKIEEYFIELYMSTFESILESIEGRYKISPIALSIEKYLAATNETELEECGESISTIAAHVVSNSLQLKMEKKQFRRYEIETKIPPATCVDEIGITLSSNTALRTILQTLSNVVQLVLLVPATSCTPERTFSVLCRLKTYLRSTMTQARLNHLAVIHCNKDIADSLDLDQLNDEWREVCSHRQNAVASSIESKEWAAQP